MLALLPLFAVAVSQPPSPRVAQVELAEALATADAIDDVTTAGPADAPTITFAIDRDHRAYHIVVRTSREAVMTVEIIEAGAAPTDRGALSWLAPELVDAAAITQLSITAGTPRVVIVTDDARRYLAIPDRGTATAVEARWAAAWDADA